MFFMFKHIPNNMLLLILEHTASTCSVWKVPCVHTDVIWLILVLLLLLNLPPRFGMQFFQREKKKSPFVCAAKLGTPDKPTN